MASSCWAKASPTSAASRSRTWLSTTRWRASPQPPKIDGFTPEQRFFLSFARIWGTTARPEFERMSVTVDPHPLPRFRANGALMNTPAFAQAFDCKAGDPMVKPAGQVCKIW